MRLNTSLLICLLLAACGDKSDGDDGSANDGGGVADGGTSDGGGGGTGDGGISDGGTSGTDGGGTGDGGTTDGGTADGGGTGDGGTGDGGTGDGGTSDGGTSDGGTGDGGGGDDTGEVGPVVITGDATVDDNPSNPFSALVTVTVDQDAELRVRYGEHAFTHETPVVSVVAGEEATVQLLGLHADTAYQLEAVATQGESTWTSDALAYTTAPLPVDWPVCTPTFGVSPASFDPDEVVCTQGVTSRGQYMYFCTDYFGEPVFSLSSSGNDSMMSMRPLRDGGWASTSYTSSRILLFDSTGEQTGSYSTSYFARDARYTHDFIDSHEMVEFTSGDWEGALGFLTQAYEYFDDGSYKLGNGLIVFDPVEREVLYDWSFHGELGDGEPMDPRMPYSSEGRGDYAQDWTHANTILHGMEEDGREYLLISVKSQDWVFKLYPDTDELAWALGYAGDFTLVDDVDAAEPLELGALEWAYHQHGLVFVEPDDDNLHILMYDNGYPRHDGRQYRYDLYYSRLVQMELDQDTMRADIDWQYGSSTWGADDHIYSSTCGNTILLQDEARVMSLDGEDATMIEVTYPDGEERWRMQCETSEWCEYRVAWFPNMYETDWAVR